jgi:hypothetical protein
VQYSGVRRSRFLLLEILLFSMSMRIEVLQNTRPLLLSLAVTLFALPIISAGAAQDPWIVPARIIRNGELDGSAIYLKSGLIITAAHLTAAEANMGVLIGGAALAATVVKQGKFEDVDLTLLSVDPRKLPAIVLRIQTPLCEAPVWPGDPVLVVDHAGAIRSRIISPQILPLNLQNKFHTLIAAVAQGQSGSGVFDPKHKCLLGIMSRAIVRDGKDVAKYFVPAIEIRDFIPVEFRASVPMK